MATSLSAYTASAQSTIKILGALFKSAATLDLITIGAPIAATSAGQIALVNSLFGIYGAQAGTVLVSSPTFPGYAATSTSAEFAATLIDTMTAGTTISTTVKDAWKAAVVTLLPSYASRGALAVALMNLVDTYTGSDASVIALNAVMDNRAEYSAGYSQTAAGATFSSVATLVSTVSSITSAVSSITPVVTGTTYTLTTAADTLTGTVNDDTFVGLVDAATTANSTLSAADTINGSSGTGDVLNITTQAGTAVADAVNGALVSGIETVNLRATSTAGVTMAAGNVSGVTLINNNISTDAVTLTGIASTTALRITGNANTTNGATTATFLGSATAGAVTLLSGTTAGAVTLNGTGFTSLTITSSGATNTIGAIDSSTSTAIATTTINAETAFLTTGLTVGTVGAGGQTLVISGAAGDRAATSTAAARSAVTLGALDADYVSVNASGLTVGGVSATLSATTSATFTGGAGVDRITTSNSGQTGAIDAGAGTDILTLAATAHIDTTGEGTIYKNFEVLNVDSTGAAVSIDLDTITFTSSGSTITSIMIADAANATSVTDMSATQAAAVTVTAGAGAITLGVKNAGTTGNLDTLNITVSDGDTTPSEAIWGTGDVTLAGVETVSITATDDVTWASMANISGLTKLTVTGGGDVSITTGAHVVTANEIVDFSALTAASTFNMAGATTLALAFTGGSGVDTVTNSAIGGNVIKTGAGRDVITLTQKTAGTADTITPGAGGDAITATNVGNETWDKFTLKFEAGDSVADSSVTGTGFLAALMDAVTAVDFANAAAAAAGHVITFDTVQSATAQTWSATAVTFGTTAVTNAYDFYIYNTGAGGITYVYQDTDGDKLIETGEFGIQLTGVAATDSASAEFTIVAGNLLLTTA